jgi:hypothetical protein
LAARGHPAAFELVHWFTGKMALLFVPHSFYIYGEAGSIPQLKATGAARS